METTESQMVLQQIYLDFLRTCLEWEAGGEVAKINHLAASMDPDMLKRIQEDALAQILSEIEIFETREKLQNAAERFFKEQVVPLNKVSQIYDDRRSYLEGLRVRIRGKNSALSLAKLNLGDTEANQVSNENKLNMDEGRFSALIVQSHLLQVQIAEIVLHFLREHEKQSNLLRADLRGSICEILDDLRCRLALLNQRISTEHQDLRGEIELAKNFLDESVEALVEIEQNIKNIP